MGSLYFFLEQNWLDVENGVVSIGGGAVVIVDLEFMVAAAGHCEVVLPLSEVELIEVVVEDKP